MNIYKIYIALIVILLITMATTVPAENIFTITDETEDVLDQNEDLISYPDLDIKEISFGRNGKQVDYILKLAEGGKILDTGFVVAYTVYLTTSNKVYELVYGYSDVDLEELSFDGFTVTAYEDYDYMLSGGNGVDINVKSESGVGTNELKISFDLLNDYEKLITAEGASLYLGDMTGTEFYIDDLAVNISNFPTVDAGGSYDGNSGNKITFEGSINQGNPSSYNWIWTIDDTSITKEGQTAQHTFVTPGSYTGTLYVYDGQGKYSEDSFTIQITGSSNNGSNNGGNNNQPGFEIIVMLAAIAIALIILRKKK